MKRLLAVAAVTPLALLAFSGPALAAKPDVYHSTFTSAYAETYWSNGDAETFMEGGVHAALTSDGPQLDVWRIEGDSNGHTQTSLTGEGDYTFTIDKGRLRSARLVGQHLGTTTCTYDAEGEEVGPCTPGTIDIEITWTGEGKITRGGTTDRYKGDGFSINVHMQSTNRAASVVGAISGSISVDEFPEGSLGTYKQVETKRCAPTACEEPMK